MSSFLANVSVSGRGRKKKKTTKKPTNPNPIVRPLQYFKLITSKHQR